MEQDFLTAVQYLYNLPKSDLDDRTFEELVEECLLRIPRYCPEWTNYNPGDPGVTLIELFAWLVHQMLARFNQVPRRHYVAFLELLGVQLKPPISAKTELTFYLTKAQSSVKLIPAGTEVATVRTENQEAEVFTTDRDLVVGQARLSHLLFGTHLLHHERPGDFANYFDRLIDSQTLSGSQIPLSLFEPCEVNRCFYLVLEAAEIEETTTPRSRNTELENTIEGNVLAFTFKGPAAVTTGINPNKPPLEWQAWDGEQWCGGILREQADDKTKGFSFDKLGESGPNPEGEGADVILHLPQHWPQCEFGEYRGHWIRCVYVAPDDRQQQFGYQRSPQIQEIEVRSLGVVGSASECIRIEQELLGISDGKAGQTFALSRQPILQRQPNERIEIRLPNNDQPEPWQEVSNFGDSSPDSRHYLIDSINGTVQFGPLIREPDQLQKQTQERSQLQSWGRPMRIRKAVPLSGHESTIPAVLESVDRQAERQYGKVPPKGAEVYITGYRVGGGSRGNVQAGQLKVLKSSIPYVRQVTNYAAAEGGLNAEALEQAMIRVPALLRTRETALTPEDFEKTAKDFSVKTEKDFGEKPVVYRAHCITASHLTLPGVVRLLVIPELPQNVLRELGQVGLHPDQLLLKGEFPKKALQEHLDLHKSLGIRVTTESPEYVGIQVHVEIYPQAQYHSANERALIAHKLKAQLYRFLNPATGGSKAKGWPLGRSVQSADIVALLRKVPEVHSVGQVQLFKWQPYRHRQEVGWMRVPTPMNKIDIGAIALPTSWATSWATAEANPDEPSSDHEIVFLEL